jgi:hypothetical protein
MIDILGWISNLTMEAKLATGMTGQAFADTILNYATVGVWGEVRLNVLRVLNQVENIGGDLYYIYNWLTGNTGSFASGDRLPPLPTPSVAVTVDSGQHSVYDVSEHHFQSQQYGDAILGLNPGLADAQTWRTGAPIQAGDLIKIPILTGMVNNSGPPLGVDWAVENQDLVWDDEAGDMVLVRDLECYIQNTAHRLETPRNSNRAFRGTGTRSINDGPFERSSADVASDVQSQVLLDPRTDRISRLDYREDPPTVHVDVSIKVVTQKDVGITYKES